MLIHVKKEISRIYDGIDTAKPQKWHHRRKILINVLEEDKKEKENLRKLNEKSTKILIF